jgi:hypothetical protein
VYLARVTNLRTETDMRPYLTAVLGVVLFGIACDRESPTDVPLKTPAAVGTPSFAAGGGNKPTSGYEIKSFASNIAGGFLGVIEVYCPAGKRALGGGFKVGGGAPLSAPDVAIYESTPRVTDPNQGTDGWRVEAMNRTGETRLIEAWVICAPI